MTLKLRTSKRHRQRPITTFQLFFAILLTCGILLTSRVLGPVRLCCIGNEVRNLTNTNSIGPSLSNITRHGHADVVVNSTIRYLLQDQFNEKRKQLYHENTMNARNCTKRHPGAVIIGIQKCGTTALSKFLSFHPQISIRTEQAYFFTSNYFLGLDWYLDFLPCSTNHQIVIERTPQYFFSKKASRRIKRMKSDMKLILIVCEPVRRLLSNYEMAKYRSRESNNSDLNAAVFVGSESDKTVNTLSKYIRKSLYFKHVQPWLQEFSLDRMLVIDGKSFIRAPATELYTVEAFLGITRFFRPEQFVVNPDTGFNCFRTKGRLNCLPRTKGKKYRNVDNKTISILRDFYKDKNEVFFKTINRRFDW